MPPKKRGKRPQTSNGEKASNEKKSKSNDTKSANFNIRKEVQVDASVRDLSNAWKSKKTDDKLFLGGDVNIVTDPFRCCVVKDFIGEKNTVDPLLQELISDLDKLELLEKNNDLYKFRQSKDLFQSEIPSVAALKTFLVEDVKPWLQKVTGIEDLNDTVDMFCAKYAHTDHLLCHDDKLEGRRIAYILYLVPEDWTAEDGGALDLFSSENGKPSKVAKSICPSFNAFAFFEVSPASFHQVAEVLSRDKVRLSVTGWFHGPSLKQNDIYVGPKQVAPKDITEQEFYWWINPMYLDPFTQTEIREKFEESSEISLPDFLIAEKYQEMCLALARIKEQWVTLGPPNKRSYDVLPFPDKDKALLKPASVDLVRSCVNFLTSDALCLVLSNLTGLKLHHLAENHDSENGDDSNAKDTSEKDTSERDASEKDISEKGDEITDNDMGDFSDADPKPDADDSKWSKEAEDKITQIQKSGVENHDENETDKKLKEDLSSSLAKTKHKSELKKNPTEHSANNSAKEATISESGQSLDSQESVHLLSKEDESIAEDNWSTASTFGESESKFSVRTDVQSTTSSRTSKSKTVKKVEIRVDEKPEKISNEAGPSTAPSASDDNWSIAATVGENVEPSVLIRSEVRRWRKGCYSLLFDDDGSEYNVAFLGARLFFNCPKDWDLKWGGYSSFIAKDDDEELLTAPPVPNTLSLVFTEPDTLGFVKYVSSEFTQDEFHDIAISYVEQSPDD